MTLTEMKRPNPAHIYRTSITSECENIYLWGDREHQGYHWTEQLLALEFLSVWGEGGSQNYIQWAKPG